MNAVDEILTPRLLLRRMTATDRDLLTHLHLDPRVMATMGGIRSPEVTADWLTVQVAHWEQHGFGLWMAHDRATGEFVGRGGLHQVEIDNRQEIEVAYCLRAEFWGRGLATELARASIHIAFTRLEVPELVCFTLTTNLASQHVMQKAGFSYQRDLIYKDLPHVLYLLRQVDWQAESTENVT